MRLVVRMDRPSEFSGDRLYKFFMEKAVKGRTYTNRQIAEMMRLKDGKEHSPSWVKQKMEQYILEGKKGIAKSVDAKTGRFVGWRKKP